MNPVTLIAVLDFALGLIEKLTPEIVAMTKRGEITTDQQKELMRRVAAIRTGEAFSGPEWEVKP